MKVLSGQSLFDMAIQHCGNPESVFDLSVANNISITGDLTVENELIETGVVNRDIYDYYLRNKYFPATSITTEDRQFIGRIFDFTFRKTFN